MIAHLLLDPTVRPIIGHRGASGSAPENTLEAFDLAIAQGTEALELDVRLTADGVPIVIHDPTLDRTTDRSGPVASQTLKALADADAGARFSPDGVRYPFRERGIRIPTLRQVLERYPTVPLLIEAKVAVAREPIRDELVRAGAEQRAVVAAFSDRALTAFRKSPFLSGASRADIVRHVVLTWLGIRRGGREAGERAARPPLCYAVPFRYKELVELPTTRFIQAAHRAGRPVHVWTVNDPTLARTLWHRGANGMITNYPALMRGERDRIGG